MILPFVVVVIASTVRILSMVGTGIAQEATATTIISSPKESLAAEAVFRQEKRMRYKRWLWWTRFGMVITVLQVMGATYLMFTIVKYVSSNGTKGCFLGPDPHGIELEKNILVILIISVWFLAILQCIAGSDVLRWRSFYATHDNAWKAHYHEVFDHGIREALCCLGRVKYLSVLEEDEVYSVAQLLGDLVAYRASGTGHLELLAGLALLQRHTQKIDSYEELVEAPEEKIQEAATFHQFAEAAYTGPLFDFGRNPVLFPCAWLYRQGVLTPWTRERRPVLEGDNWWRGHAAAFLKYVNLSPEALRKGRVSQAKCQAAYYIAVLHDLQSVVIAVRGTETPEDLLTDGLCRECPLEMEDLDGLINSYSVHPDVRQRVLSSFPHYGHSGIVETARDLFMQVDGQPGDNDSAGFLSSLLGVGCECQGYNVRIVGHSLGGAIAAMLGIRLYSRYPNLHVYTYGSLPCVDYSIAEACSDFITSIVYRYEFSSYLSVNSIMRLRASAISALSKDPASDSAMIYRLTQQIFHISKCYKAKEAVSSSFHPRAVTNEDNNYHTYTTNHYNNTITETAELDQAFPSQNTTTSNESQSAAILGESYDEGQNDFAVSYFGSGDARSGEDAVADFLNAVPLASAASTGESPEVYIPGLVIHILPQKGSPLPLWKSWRVHESEQNFKAYLAKRENFKDIIVSPYMFLDHLPWRCHHAMQKVLEIKALLRLSVPDMV